MGQWVGSRQIIKNRVNCHLIEIIEFCLKIYDLWTHSPHFDRSMGGWLGGWVGQWVGSCQIIKNRVNCHLIEIIEFCLKMQGLFACVGSGDPVRVLRLFHNNYTGYCCIHLLCRSTYNLSLPRLRANYYGLPTTVQLRAAHESRCSLVGVSRSTALQVLYCTCLERYHYGTVQSSLCREIFRGN